MLERIHFNAATEYSTDIWKISYFVLNLEYFKYKNIPYRDIQFPKVPAKIIVPLHVNTTQ